MIHHSLGNEKKPRPKGVMSTKGTIARVKDLMEDVKPWLVNQVLTICTPDGKGRCFRAAFGIVKAGPNPSYIHLL